MLVMVVATVVRCVRERLEFMYIARHAAWSTINLKHDLLLICILPFGILPGTLLSWSPSPHKARFATASQMLFYIPLQDLTP